jgi:hypothetical protein
MAKETQSASTKHHSSSRLLISARTSSRLPRVLYVTQVVATVAEPPASEPSTPDMALITELSIEQTHSWANVNGRITKGRG